MITIVDPRVAGPFGGGTMSQELELRSSQLYVSEARFVDRPTTGSQSRFATTSFKRKFWLASEGGRYPLARAPHARYHEHPTKLRVTHLVFGTSHFSGIPALRRPAK